MSQFLYGAEAHGIQNYIFRTNTLKEIIGASLLVDDLPDEILKNFNISKVLQSAAGSIKCLLNEESAKNIFKNAPKLVAEFAPGVKFSQAIVKVEGSIREKDLKSLQKKLADARNQIHEFGKEGKMGVQMYRQTGFAVTNKYGLNNPKYMDSTTFKKLEYNDEKVKGQKAFIGEKRISYEENIEKLITLDGREDKWIAVIHADGNGIGQSIRNLLKETKNEPKQAEILHDFSQRMTFSTNTAFERTVEKTFNINEEEDIPARRIILGGDDITFLIDADYALDFTQNFLQSFETETKKQFEEMKLESVKNGFTACAGIAYTKSKFPFHYGVDLANQLCKTAKDRSKVFAENNRTPSSLLFHKIKDSIYSGYDEIIGKELQPGGRRMDAGPYFLNEFGENTIKDLRLDAKTVLTNEGFASNLRKWVSELFISSENAAFILKRMSQLSTNKKTEKLIDEMSGANACRAVDLLTIISLEKH